MKDTRPATQPKPSPDVLNELAEAEYVSLESYRRDGTPVRVPVWCARDGDRIVIWTGRDSYKAKRLRRNPKCALARCNGSGKKILGPFHPGRAELDESPQRIQEVIGLLQRKYTWKMTLIRWGLKLRKQHDSHIVLEFSPGAA